MDIDTYLEQVELPDWVAWIAKDEDGCYWGYQVEPLQYDRGWYENEVGRLMRLPDLHSDIDWRQSLLRYNKN
jgi:hypothetical protein